MQNTVVIITGASSGIGEATAHLLAQRGAAVVLGARRADKLETAVKSIERSGGRAAWRVTDVTKRKDLVSLVDLALERFGRIDVLVNNAGIAPISRFDQLKEDDWDRMIDVNFRGVLHGIAAVLPHFKTSGHIINIVSTAGIQLVPTMGIYAATKNAVRTATEILRQESTGFRVTEISPGYVATEFSSHIDPEIRKTLDESIGISAEAIARAVLFAMEQPPDVDVGSIVIRPTVQK